MEIRFSKVVLLSVAFHAALFMALANLPKSDIHSEIVGSPAVKVSFYSNHNGNAWAQVDTRLNSAESTPFFTERAEHSPQQDKVRDKQLMSNSSSRGRSANVASHFSKNVEMNPASSSAFQLPVLERDSIIVPRFTDDALNRGFRGILVFELSLDEEGRVVETRLRNPTGLRIDREAIASARNARYVPAKDLYGRPISSKAELSFAFLGH